MNYELFKFHNQFSIPYVFSFGDGFYAPQENLLNALQKLPFLRKRGWKPSLVSPLVKWDGFECWTN